MTYDVYDPAKMAKSPEFCPPMHCDMPKVGPGGNTTLIENDEKGILETGLMGVIARHQRAELGSDHDSFKQGIYTTNSVGDAD